MSKVVRRYSAAVLQGMGGYRLRCVGLECGVSGVATMSCSRLVRAILVAQFRADLKRRRRYVFQGRRYQTLAALIISYLDAHRVFTGRVKPPSVAQFVADTGIQTSHGTYGARLHEFCHVPRQDRHGRTYLIDRNALRSGRDGRLYTDEVRR